MWSELALTLEEFYSQNSKCKNYISARIKAILELISVVHMIRDDILPFATSMPKEFVMKIMQILNKGSIHSTTSDGIYSRKLREEFAKTCFETLLQFSFISKTKAEEGTITKIAVLSLLQQCQEVAITTLLISLKKAPQGNIESGVWQQIINLYPFLVDCTTSPSPNVCKALKDTLREYKDLLAPPGSSAINGTP
ncbi:hypothetical protein KUTeg_011269 [Tegillarca granosa]|uniref:Mon2 C-terminal domain-containing protein n=1 Tax=Tegillarca granosa TaxID=220873 RepID=A0ABQ9F1B2_TEGGR|nr:hypothetical protein KUTeg_011269 [Tegillarca granosa]